MKSNWLISLAYYWFSKIQSYSNNPRHALFCEEWGRVMDHMNKAVFLKTRLCAKSIKINCNHCQMISIRISTKIQVWVIWNESYKMSHRTYQHRSYVNNSLILRFLSSLKNGWMMALQSCGSNLGHVIGSFVGLATDSMLFGLLWVKFLKKIHLKPPKNLNP